MIDYNADNMIANDNVIQAREFWNAKVYKIIQNYEYGKITCETMIDELVLMGYDEDQILDLLEEDEDY